ncbi:Zinc finger protein 26 [Araneus ventricosus]|uniref:Zinc finger protein 26 n=1 Tax=Araneus ventricosus TaxID=182803 RepID=A0A4Y2C4W0_ARAVE|nr:Zinc finger protein 26 [Araneus ventricosus]
MWKKVLQGQTIIKSAKFLSSSNRRHNWHIPSILENSPDTQSRHRFQCSQCPYGTASNADLKKHILTHTGEKPHACNVCGRGFALKENLKRHYITHLTDLGVDVRTSGSQTFDTNEHNDDKVQTPKPKRSLKNQESTKIKVPGAKKAETQTPEEAMSIIYDETHDCPEPHCSYSTSSRRQFQKHVLIHSDQRPYSCFVCDYTFKRSDSLRQHLLTHSGEKPYACGFCPMHFTHRTLVSPLQKFKGKTFIDNVELDVATPAVDSLEALLNEICTEKNDKTTPKPKDDEICYEKCKIMPQLEDAAAETATMQSRRIVPEPKNGGVKYVCNMLHCHYEASSKAQYKKHQRLHSEINSFLCHVCNEKFKLEGYYKRHMRIHPEEKPYACDFCPKKYTSESSLRRHLRGTHDSQQDLH